VITRALHWSLSWARWIQSIPPHPISLRSILIFSSHLCLGLLVPSFLLAVPEFYLYMHNSSHSYVLHVDLVAFESFFFCYDISWMNPVPKGLRS
jgi:hypothetical protein